MSGDNVISLGTRKPLAEDKAELKRAEEVHQKHLDGEAAKHRDGLLQLLDNLKDRVKAGEIDGLVVAGRNPENGAFLSTAALNPSATRVDTYLAYAGILNAMNFDMVDLANSGPHMNSDGSFFALGEVQDIPLEDEE